MGGAASHHLGNQAIVGPGVLQDLDALNRFRNSEPSRYAVRNKRDLIGQVLECPDRPIFDLDRAGGETEGVVGDPMIVAQPINFTRGAAEDTGGNRTPGLCLVNVIPVPNRICGSTRPPPVSTVVLTERSRGASVMSRSQRDIGRVLARSRGGKSPLDGSGR